MEEHIYNPSAWEAEAGGLLRLVYVRFLGQLGLAYNETALQTKQKKGNLSWGLLN